MSHNRKVWDELVERTRKLVNEADESIKKHVVYENHYVDVEQITPMSYSTLALCKCGATCVFPTTSSKAQCSQGPSILMDHFIGC